MVRAGSRPDSTCEGQSAPRALSLDLVRGQEVAVWGRRRRVKLRIALLVSLGQVPVCGRGAERTRHEQGVAGGQTPAGHVGLHEGNLVFFQ